MAEPTAEEIRAELEREVFGGESEEPMASQEEQHQVPEGTDPAPGTGSADAPAESADPWSGVPAIVRQKIEALDKRAADLNAWEERLKQTERRVGTVQYKISEAEKARQAASPPPKVELPKAEKWEALREEFPEFVEAYEERIAQIQAVQPPAGVPQEVIDARVKEAVAQARVDMQREIEIAKLESRHPDWDEKHRSQEFQAWLSAQPDEIKQQASSPFARNVISVLDKYDAAVKPKAPADIAGQRQRRLEAAQSVRTARRATPVKSVADMTDEEYRAHVASELWETP